MNLRSYLVGATMVAGMTISAAGFEVQTRVVQEPEMGSVTNHILMLPHARVAFMPPPGWTLQVDASQGSLGISSGGEALGEELIQIRLHKPSTRVSPSSGRTWTRREQILARYSGAVVVGNGACYTEGERGDYVDLDWKSENSKVYRLRVATVKVAGVSLEVTFQTTPSRAPKSLATFQGLLTSLQAVKTAP